MKVVKPYSQVRIRMAVRALLRLLGFRKVRGHDELDISSPGREPLWVRPNGHVYLGYHGRQRVSWDESSLTQLIDNLGLAVDVWRDEIHAVNDQTGKFNQMVKFIEIVVRAQLNADRLKVLRDWIKQTEGGDRDV